MGNNSVIQYATFGYKYYVQLVSYFATTEFIFYRFFYMFVTM